MKDGKFGSRNGQPGGGQSEESPLKRHRSVMGYSEDAPKDPGSGTIRNNAGFVNQTIMAIKEYERQKELERLNPKPKPKVHKYHHSNLPGDLQ